MGRPRSRAMMQDVELVDATDLPRAPRRPIASSPPADISPGSPPGRPGPTGDPVHSDPTEHAESAEHAEHPEHAEPPDHPEHSRRRRAVVVLVTVVLVLGGVVAIGRAASRDVPHAQVPAGMLAHLDAPPWVRWRAPAGRGDDVLAATGVVVVDAVRQGRFTMSAYEENTGEAAWERDLGPVSGTRPLTGCPHGDAGVGDTLLCVVEPPVIPGEDWVGRVAPVRPVWPERWVRVSAISADTGDVLGQWSLRGRVTAVERIGDDLVALVLGEDGHAQVGRYDGRSGDLRWWYRSTEPVRLREGITPGAELRVNDTFVLVQGWSATVLSVDDGRELTSAPPTWFVVGALSDDLFGTWSSSDGGTVRDRRGRVLFTSRALFPAVTATDGRPLGVVVMDEGRTLVGRAVPDGTRLWRLETYRAVRLQVDGRLVLLGVDGYQVVDVVTGRVQWETPSRVLMWWAPLSDGRLVLAAGRTVTGSPTIEARNLDGGDLEWSLPLEPGVRAVTAIGGHLLLRTRDEVVALG